MALADIHIHLLLGADDGAKDEEVMHAILDVAKGPKREIQTRELYMGKCGGKRQLRIPFSGFTTFARVWHHVG